MPLRLLFHARQGIKCRPACPVKSFNPFPARDLPF
jgi:hypothetical protein